MVSSVNSLKYRFEASQALTLNVLANTVDTSVSVLEMLTIRDRARFACVRKSFKEALANMPLPDNWKTVTEAVPQVRLISSMRGLFSLYNKVFETPNCYGVIQEQRPGNLKTLLVITSQTIHNVVLGERNKYLGMAHNTAYFGNPNSNVQGQSLNLLMINISTGQRIQEEFSVHDAFAEKERLQKLAEEDEKKSVAEDPRNWRIVKVDEMPPQLVEGLLSSRPKQQKRLFTMTVAGVITIWSRKEFLGGEKWWPDSHRNLAEMLNLGPDHSVIRVSGDNRRVGNVFGLCTVSSIMPFFDISKNFAPIPLEFPKGNFPDSKQAWSENLSLHPADSLPVLKDSKDAKREDFEGLGRVTDRFFLMFGNKLVSAFEPSEGAVQFRWSWKLPRDLEEKGHRITDVMGEKDFVVVDTSNEIDGIIHEKVFHVIREGAHLYTPSTSDRPVRSQAQEVRSNILGCSRALVKDGYLFFQSFCGPLEMVHLATGKKKTILLHGKLIDLFSHSFPDQQSRQLVILTRGLRMNLDRNYNSNDETVLEEIVLDSGPQVPPRVGAAPVNQSLRSFPLVKMSVSEFFCEILLWVASCIVSCVRLCFHTIGFGQGRGVPARP